MTHFLVYLSCGKFADRKLLFVAESIDDIKKKINIDELKKANGYVIDNENIKTIGLYDVKENTIDDFWENYDRVLIILSVKSIMDINSIIEEFKELGQCDYYEVDDE